MDVLWPCYGLCMCQAAALILVPDIPHTDKKTVKKFTTCFTLYNLLSTLPFTLLYYFTLPNMMSGIN